MKIRTDFVTNSSSCNYCVEVTVYDENDRLYSFYDDPFEYNEEEGGTARFRGSLEDANRFSSVEELCKFLTDSVESDSWASRDKSYSAKIKARKTRFTKKVLQNVKSVSEIKSITVERKYSAWGEFIDVDFGRDYDDFRYPEGVAGARSVNGIEYQEIDMKTGEYTAYAEITDFD